MTPVIAVSEVAVSEVAVSVIVGSKAMGQPVWLTHVTAAVKTAEWLRAGGPTGSRQRQRRQWCNHPK